MYTVNKTVIKINEGSRCKMDEKKKEKITKAVVFKNTLFWT